jgi:hypothetical protein
MNSFIRPFNKRILVVTGHYGSGKTEFAVSFALLNARMPRRPVPRLALVDLDIANPYFRSRERRELLEAAGVGVYGSLYKTEITAELPALSADIRAPLEDEGCFVIVDAGGYDSGALVVIQFGNYFTPVQSAVAAVINASRPETRDADARSAIYPPSKASPALKSGIVNNTHLLRQTTPETIAAGHALCVSVSPGPARSSGAIVTPSRSCRETSSWASPIIGCRSACICVRPGWTGRRRSPVPADPDLIIEIVYIPKGANLWQNSKFSSAATNAKAASCALRSAPKGSLL